MLVGQKLRKVALDFVRIGMARQPKPVGHAPHMGVHGDGRMAEDMTQHNICSLAPHSRQGQQIAHRTGDLAVKTRDDRFGGFDQRARLGAKKPGAADYFFQRTGVAIGSRNCVGKDCEKMRCDSIDAFIRALRREYHRGQTLPW